jgi:hypothetical protein
LGVAAAGVAIVFGGGGLSDDDVLDDVGEGDDTRISISLSDESDDDDDVFDLDLTGDVNASSPSLSEGL